MFGLNIFHSWHEKGLGRAKKLKSSHFSLLCFQDVLRGLQEWVPALGDLLPGSRHLSGRGRHWSQVGGSAYGWQLGTKSECWRMQEFPWVLRCEKKGYGQITSWKRRCLGGGGGQELEAGRRMISKLRSQLMDSTWVQRVNDGECRNYREFWDVKIRRFGLFTGLKRRGQVGMA